MVEVQQWWQIHNETEYVWNIEVDIFHLRHWSSSECVGEEMMLLMEWRDIWRGTEMECVQSVEVKIFCLRSWLIEVSPSIHPPFKGVTTWHYWWYVAKRDGVEFHKLNLLRHSREILMKFWWNSATYFRAWTLFAGSQELCSIPNPSCKGNCGAELNQILAGGPKLIYYNK